MKKVLFVLVIAASFTACNNASEKAASTTIDSARLADSMKSATSAMDSAAKKMDTAAKKIDTAAKKIDSTVKKM